MGTIGTKTMGAMEHTAITTTVCKTKHISLVEMLVKFT